MEPIGADRADAARARGARSLAGNASTPRQATALLEAVIEPGDRVCLEGNNQKQADFLAACLVGVDPARVHDLHLVQSVLALPEHIDLFERGIAKRLDFSFSGPQGARLAQLVGEGRIEIGAIHTYLELFGRYFVDLTPQREPHRRAGGRLPAATCTPARTPKTRRPSSRRRRSAAASSSRRSTRSGDALPRVDVPCDWVDFVIVAPQPHYIEPLFTRDPAQISEIQVLMAMMAIKGIYAEYGVQRLNHGIGFDTAAIELLLPTYAESLGLNGKICRHWALNPHPTLIPAIEVGLRRIGALVRLRARHGALHRGAPGRLLHGPRRIDALQPRVLPGGGSLRVRPVHRLDAADRSRGQQLHGDEGPHHWIRRRAEHGLRCARAPP